jgi:NAD dependent epimerase/dehydratase family enzyme
MQQQQQQQQQQSKLYNRGALLALAGKKIAKRHSKENIQQNILFSKRHLLESCPSAVVTKQMRHCCLLIVIGRIT